jgi:hypothetical protein
VEVLGMFAIVSCTLGFEAQRDKNGKLLKLQDQPTKRQCWNDLGDIN